MTKPSFKPWSGGGGSGDGGGIVFFFWGGGGGGGAGGIKMKSVFADETGITRPAHERSPLGIAGLSRQTYCRS